ncbi:unnamed protein product [Amoebophrya sp. A120]|nr:unnamed protein product [Amoebophrya sp. A120]|eukprot:GSA120T00020909001.1
MQEKFHPGIMPRNTFPVEMKMFEPLLAALHELSCHNPIHVDAFLMGLWNPSERQELFQWLKMILETSEIPSSVFFKTTQMFDRFLEHTVLNSSGLGHSTLLQNNGSSSLQGGHNAGGFVNKAGKVICPSPMSASVSTVASSPKTPDQAQGTPSPLNPSNILSAVHQQQSELYGRQIPTVLEDLHQDIATQLGSQFIVQDLPNPIGEGGELTPQHVANPVFNSNWSQTMTHRALGLACTSLVMKLDFRKHYSKHYDSLIQAAVPYLFPSNNSNSGSGGAAGGNTNSSSGNNNANNNASSANRSNSAGNSYEMNTSSSGVGGPDYNSASSVSAEQYGGIDNVGNYVTTAPVPEIRYAFSCASAKAFIQSLEWPIIKYLRFRLSVPCLIDFLDYFDTQCQIRSKKSYAVDVILYHPELLYGNKMTSIALAIWFLSHKNQDYVHAILQKMQTFDSFAPSKRLEEKRRLMQEAPGSQSPATAQISEHAISTADLRALVSQLRDGFRSHTILHRGVVNGGSSATGAAGAHGQASTSGALGGHSGCVTIPQGTPPGVCPINPHVSGAQHLVAQQQQQSSNHNCSAATSQQQDAIMSEAGTTAPAPPPVASIPTPCSNTTMNSSSQQQHGGHSGQHATEQNQQQHLRGSFSDATTTVLGGAGGSCSVSMNNQHQAMEVVQQSMEMDVVGQQQHLGTSAGTATTAPRNDSYHIVMHQQQDQFSQHRDSMSISSSTSQCNGTSLRDQFSTQTSQSSSQQMSDIGGTSSGGQQQHQHNNMGNNQQSQFNIHQQHNHNDTGGLQARTSLGGGGTTTTGASNGATGSLFNPSESSTHRIRATVGEINQRHHSATASAGQGQLVHQNSAFGSMLNGGGSCTTKPGQQHQQHNNSLSTNTTAISSAGGSNSSFHNSSTHQVDATMLSSGGSSCSTTLHNRGNNSFYNSLQQLSTSTTSGTTTGANNNGPQHMSIDLTTSNSSSQSAGNGCGSVNVTMKQQHDHTSTTNSLFSIAGSSTTSGQHLPSCGSATGTTTASTWAAGGQPAQHNNSMLDHSMQQHSDLPPRKQPRGHSGTTSAGATGGYNRGSGNAPTTSGQYSGQLAQPANAATMQTCWNKSKYTYK